MAPQDTVQPHTTNAVVWDVPSAVEADKRFRMKVGLKCSENCVLTKKDFGIYDHEGRQAGSGTLPDKVWPGTTGLYVAEVELEAPGREGLYTWTVRFPGPDAGVAHTESSVSFGVQVVGHPEYVMTVQTVDRLSQNPLPGVRVVMHPYRAIADERGEAKVRVAKGSYKLFVSQTRYLTFHLPVEVTADKTARVELELEPERERN